MAYLALLTDTHFGIKQDSSVFYNYQKRVFDESIFPELQRRKSKIDKIVHLGDFFDKRKQINFSTLQFAKTQILDNLKDFPIEIILGNHDCTYKNTNSLNSPSLLLTEYNNIKIYDETTEVDDVLYVPWITPENSVDTFQKIQDTEKKILFGHLELVGYQMFKGAVCDHGLSSDIFYKFLTVLSGHFHSKSNKGNIHYLGCPWDLIFTDADEIKGFHFFDTETCELEFVENPYKIFNKLYYDDMGFDDLSQLILSDSKYLSLSDTFVKVYVKNKTNPVFFNRYCERLADANPNSIVYIEESYENDNNETITISEDTLSIIKTSMDDYMDLIQTEEKKEQLEKLVSELYIKALHI